jgi:dynein heavy chain
LAVLEPKAFNEVKALAQPPTAIKDVCHCVCILKPLGPDNPPESEGWVSSKAMLTNASLLKKMKDYDKEKISQGMYRKVSEYFKKPEFTYETIKKVNIATANLFMWVEAMKMYYEVNRKIEPLRKELKSAR